MELTYLQNGVCGLAPKNCRAWIVWPKQDRSKLTHHTYMYTHILLRTRLNLTCCQWYDLERSKADFNPDPSIQLWDTFWCLISEVKEFLFFFSYSDIKKDLEKTVEDPLVDIKNMSDDTRGEVSQSWVFSSLLHYHDIICLTCASRALPFTI